MTTTILKTALLSFALFTTSCCSIFTCEKESASSLSSSNEPNAAPPGKPNVKTEFVGDEKIKAELDGVWQRAIRAIKDRDAATLAAMTHPREGIRFSPYGTVQASTDVTMDAEKMALFFKTSVSLTWGAFDGTGEPIHMPPREYYKRFVYNVDYMNAEKISFDKILGQGNAIENTREVYPESHFVEFYFSGFNPEYVGMDWQSLRIVFQKEGGAWFIVAIVHNEWTT